MIEQSFNLIDVTYFILIFQQCLIFLLALFRKQQPFWKDIFCVYSVCKVLCIIHTWVYSKGFLSWFFIDDTPQAYACYIFGYIYFIDAVLIIRLMLSLNNRTPNKYVDLTFLILGFFAAILPMLGDPVYIEDLVTSRLAFIGASQAFFAQNLSIILVVFSIIVLTKLTGSLYQKRHTLGQHKTIMFLTYTGFLFTVLLMIWKMAITWLYAIDPVRFLIIKWFFINSALELSIHGIIIAFLIHKMVKVTNKEKKAEINTSIVKEQFAKIDHYVNENKSFLNNRLNVEQLAKSIKIAEKDLSSAINQTQGCNFNDYINKHRIDYAKALLTSESNAHLSILDIAFEVGFNSKSTFYSAFKRHTGITPNQFRNNLRAC